MSRLNKYHILSAFAENHGRKTVNECEDFLLRQDFALPKQAEKIPRVSTRGASFILIFFIGLVLRFWKLSSTPVSLSMNEVAIAYSSFSIAETGKDEWGNFLPLAFRSVGDYKAPVLIYLMIPAIKLFGLNEFSVRFTVALFGLLTLPVVYALVWLLTKNKKTALITMFSLAISPWHLQYSRTTSEAVLALFFMLLGVTVFLWSVGSKGRILWLSVIFFVVSMYSYHAERIFVPLLVLSLFFIYFRLIKKIFHENPRVLLKSVIIGLLIVGPLVKIILTDQGQIRARSVFFTNDENIVYQLNPKGKKQTFPNSIFDSNFAMLANFWSKRYLNYFDFSFLFYKGSQFTVPGVADVGLLHLVELPFFVFGCWLVFFKKKIDTSSKLLIGTWFLIGPVVSSFTNNEQQPLRSLVWLPMPQILFGIGLTEILEKLQAFRFWLRNVFYLGFLTLLIASLGYFLDIYMIHSPIFFSEYWDYGMKEASLYAWEHQKDYKQILFDPTFGSIGPYTESIPHLHILFYGKYPPSLYQNDPHHSKNSVNFSNFVFDPINWRTDEFKENILLIGSPWSLPLKDINPAKVKKIIHFKNGSIGFIITET